MMKGMIETRTSRDKEAGEATLLEADREGIMIIAIATTTNRRSTRNTSLKTTRKRDRKDKKNIWMIKIMNLNIRPTNKLLSLNPNNKYKKWRLKKY